MKDQTSPSGPAAGQAAAGQLPLTGFIYAWLFLLVILWALNSVVVKIAIKDIPPFYAAFLRFAPALPFVGMFAYWRAGSIRITLGEFRHIFFLGLLMAAQILAFNYGSSFTTGGRTTLFIFTYPLIVPLIAPLFIKAETYKKKVIIGALIAFSGIVVALWGKLGSEGKATLKGDLIELSSGLLLAVAIVYNKRLTSFINKWKIMLWQFAVAVPLFFLSGFLFEDLNLGAVKAEAWWTVIFQAFCVSVFAFLSWQYIISRHNSAKVSVFFFATPILGMIAGAIFLNEDFDMGCLAGCVFVGGGIFFINKH